MIRKSQNQNHYITYGQMNLINDFRLFWLEFVIWVRSYMVSTITGFSDIDAIRERLYRMPVEFTAKLQPYFGIKQGEQFQHLMFMYFVHIQTFITAQNNKNQPVVDTAVREMYKDADNMSEFLASINPYWSKIQWQNLFYQLNEMLIAELFSLLTGDYVTEIEIRERLIRHVLILGDYTAAGLMYYLSPEIVTTLADAGASNLNAITLQP